MANWIRLTDAHYYLFGNEASDAISRITEENQFSKLFIGYEPDEVETVLPKELDGEKEQVFKTENLGWHMLPTVIEREERGFLDDILGRAGKKYSLPSKSSKENPGAATLIAHKKTEAKLCLKGEDGVKGAVDAINKMAREGYSSKELGAISTSISSKIFYHLPSTLNTIEQKYVKVVSSSCRLKFGHFFEPPINDDMWYYWLPSVEETFEHGYQDVLGYLVSSEEILPTRKVRFVGKDAYWKSHDKRVTFGKVEAATLQHVSQAVYYFPDLLEDMNWWADEPEEHIESISLGIRPVVYLPADIFVDIEDKYYDGSTPERALKIKRSSGY